MMILVALLSAHPKSFSRTVVGRAPLELTFRAGRPNVQMVEIPESTSGVVVIVYRKTAGPDGWYSLVTQSETGARRSGGAWVGSDWMSWQTNLGKSSPGQYGFGYPPPAGNGQYIVLSGPTQTSVDKVGFEVDYPTSQVKIQISSIKVIPAGKFDNLVDKFGQSTIATWSAKVSSGADLLKADREDKKMIALNPRAPFLDMYGGYTSGPQLHRGRFFRTQKINGRWWLVTPTGHLFYTMGVNAVGLSQPTIVSHREWMFSHLPKDSGKFKRFYAPIGQVISGPTTKGLEYDFTSQDLFLTFGRQYKSLAVGRTLRRLQSWGLNTIGNWSDDALKAARKVPYMGTVGLYGSFRSLDQAPDPFDPAFLKEVDHRLLEERGRGARDPWCIGIYVDNEINWGAGISPQGRLFYLLNVLRAPASQPAKLQLIEFLKRNYHSISELNSAWGTSWSSYGQLLDESTDLTDDQIQRTLLQSDGYAFDLAVYRMYYKTVAKEVHRILPGVLYFGSRLHAWTPEALQACAENVDVVSFNTYRPSVDHTLFDGMTVDKPAVISEWSFPARYKGSFNRGPLDADSSQTRVRLFNKFANSVLSEPRFVGWQWFSYRDEPVLGRVLDGENAAFGLVQVTDVPYRGLVGAIRKWSDSVYSHALRPKAPN